MKLFLYLFLVQAPAVQSIAQKHLIVSSPELSMIWYSNTTDSIADPDVVELVLDSMGNPMVPQLQMNWLLGPGDVTRPYGLAQEREKKFDEPTGTHYIQKYLHVADPGDDCQKMHVYRYPLYENMGVFTHGEQQITIRDKCIRWIAVNSRGDLFATNENTNEILKVDSKNIRANQLVPPTVMYSSQGPNALQVTAPGGIAVDSFFLYWSNKVLGSMTGSLVKGMSFMPAGMAQFPEVTPIAKNADAGKDYGVCLGGKNMFFTEKNNKLFGVSSAGGAIALISDALEQPRGCSWDGDGSIYVTDRAGKVYQFPGTMQHLRSVGKLKRVATMQDPYGIVVVDGCPSLGGFAISVALSLIGVIFSLRVEL
jgi:hypothetical protein